ncbi:DUF441 family protein [Bacillus cereus group sp. FL70]
MVSYLLLGIIGILALLVKEYVIAITTSIVGILLAMGQKATLHVIQQYAFPMGTFFLMLVLLVPVTSGKVSSNHIMKALNLGSVVAGFVG